MGGFRAKFDSAYEYDLVLRIAARSPQVGRVADVLYHRGKTLALPDSPSRGLLHQSRFALRGSPMVSIIIASACHRVRIRGERTYYLLKCLESIKKTTWPRYEIVVLHGRQVPALVASELKQNNVLPTAYETPFNWSKAMNQGAALATGQHLLFLNDDIEVITPDWLERLLEFSQQPAVGAVGAKLLFPSGRIQHAGVAVLDGRPRHPFYSHHGEHPGYFNNLLFPRNCIAVTGACLMTRADIFREVGGFDEALPLNYNDVDYCCASSQAVNASSALPTRDSIITNLVRGPPECGRRKRPPCKSAGERPGRKTPITTLIYPHSILTTAFDL